MRELKPCPFCGGKAINCMKQYDGRIYRLRRAEKYVVYRILSINR